MRLATTNLEIRNCEERLSKKTGNPYLIIRVEDDYGEWLNLIDRNIENKKYYTKGTYADFVLDITIRKEFSCISVIDITVTKNDQ